MKKQTTILLLLIVLLSSCFDDGDCTSTTTDLLHITFKDITTNKDSVTNVQSILLSGTDSIFHLQDTTTSITLPLNPLANVMSIDFTIDTDKHSMMIDYSATPHLITPDCGVELSFTDVNVTTHDFDSVAVKPTTLDEEITTNIVIYQ